MADDLTGASDSGAPFLAVGPVDVTIWPQLPSVALSGCAAVSTETRDGTPEQARARSREAVQRLLESGFDTVFRKVDSRLRGHLREELAGALAAWPGRVVLAPALPGEGRITRAGRQIIGEEVIDVEMQVGGLERVEIRDAETDADLDALAREMLDDEDVMPAGTAGLAAALARVISAGRPLAAPGWPPCRRSVGLIGSKAPATSEQMKLAGAAGCDVRRRSRGDPVHLDGTDALFLCGGGTASGVLEALGASRLELLGEALPRVPVARVTAGPHAGLVVCLKSGGFGPPDAIALAFRRLASGGP